MELLLILLLPLAVAVVVVGGELEEVADDDDDDDVKNALATVFNCLGGDEAVAVLDTVAPEEVLVGEL